MKTAVKIEKFAFSEGLLGQAIISSSISSKQTYSQSRFCHFNTTPLFKFAYFSCKPHYLNLFTSIKCSRTIKVFLPKVTVCLQFAAVTTKTMKFYVNTSTL